jgi:hypothetical protein
MASEGGQVIALGLSANEKLAAIARYCASNAIRKVVVFAPPQFPLSLDLPNWESVAYSQIIEYAWYYRLLQEVDSSTLLVVNECLRTQNRHDLTYNCLRSYINQTPHVLVFQHLPLIDTWDDFAILFDFATQSRWKRHKIGREKLAEVSVTGRAHIPAFNEIRIATDDRMKAAYQKEKRALIDGIGLKDPHTIPRNLYLIGGKAKLPHAFIRTPVARNNRLGQDWATFKADSYPSNPYTVFEFPHNFIDFSDFMALSGQSGFDVLTTDLKVEQWYMARYQQWAQRLTEAYALLGVQP